jgi:hypothetical protein
VRIHVIILQHQIGWCVKPQVYQKKILCYTPNDCCIEQQVINSLLEKLKGKIQLNLCSGTAELANLVFKLKDIVDIGASDNLCSISKFL